MSFFPENEAILFIPGLANLEMNQTVEAFAYRLKKSLDINSPEENDKFITELRKTTYGKDNKQECQIVSIYRVSNNEKKKVYDIYELNYCRDLIRRFEQMNVLFKTLVLFTTVTAKLPRFFWVIIRRTKGLHLRDKIQSLYVGLILLSISLYGIMLLTALVASIEQPLANQDWGSLKLGNAIQAEKQTISSILHTYFGSVTLLPAAEEVFSWMGNVLSHIYRFFADIFLLLWQIPLMVFHIALKFRDWIIGSAAILFLLLPNIRTFITNTATQYICYFNYLNVGERRLNIIGKLEEILECAAESKENYSKISIHSFSFGSIVALDALFPYDGVISERMKNIHTLITVGCPYDFIRVYWPNYYNRQKLAENKPLQLRRWYNVYSSIDILSSNFRDDSSQKEAEKMIGAQKPTNVPFNAITPEDVSTWDNFTLLGLRAHTLYWEDESYSASYLTNLFQQMKKDEEKESFEQKEEEKPRISDLSAIPAAALVN